MFQASCRNPNLSCRSFSNRSRRSFLYDTPTRILPQRARVMRIWALAFQEILTAAERLRNRPASTICRRHRFSKPVYQILEGLKADRSAGRNHGYHADDVKLAIRSAVVALVDESVLNLRSPVFADWPAAPCRRSCFGHHVAGEVFFKNLQIFWEDRLADLRGSAGDLTSCACLLGFVRSATAWAAAGDLRAVGEAVAEKIRRYSAEPRGEISPRGRCRQEAVRRAGTDPPGEDFSTASWPRPAAC